MRLDAAVGEWLAAPGTALQGRRDALPVVALVRRYSQTLRNAGSAGWVPPRVAGVSLHSG
ncbi:MAG: hypothetical protein CL938_15295 [Deltaproteobacteria bacterium]|nr:hypothetical protein [Deltaproteobacteria bacterium]MDP7073050.1 hypothetical protein [Myxococcota bacterium]